MNNQKSKNQPLCAKCGNQMVETIQLDLSIKYVCEKCLFDELKSNK